MNFLIRLASGILGLIAFVSTLIMAGILLKVGLSGEGLLASWPLSTVGFIAAVSSGLLERYSIRHPPEYHGFDVLPPRADPLANRKDA